MRLLAALMAGMLFTVVMLCCMEYIRRSRVGVSQRMRRYVAGIAPVDLQPEERLTPHQRLRLFLRGLAQLMDRVRHSQSLDLRMQRAGLPLLGSEFLIFEALLGLGSFLLGLMLTASFSSALLLGAGGVAAGWLYISIRISRRRSAFNNQLGDALSMTADAMRAGFSFLQAVELIAREMEAPMGAEFQQVIAEMQVGATLDKALDNMALRVQSSDFDLLVAAVLIQRKVGGSLAQILDSIAGTINDRIRMKREIKSLTAQGRLSGWLLAALPFGVGFMIQMISPNYLKPLFQDEFGRMVLGGAIILEVIGILVIKRIVDIDV